MEDYEFHGVHITSGIGEKIILRVIEDNDIKAFKKAEMERLVINYHKSNGGIDGKGYPLDTLKRSFMSLVAKGNIKNTSYGNYTVISVKSYGVAQKQKTQSSSYKDRFFLEHEVGQGEQSVYLFYQKNDKEIAILKEKNIWECKIGMTTIDPFQRINKQHSQTFHHSFPIIGLIIWTNDAQGLEQFIQGTLKMKKRSVSSNSSIEWFYTSPEEVLEIYKSIGENDALA